MALIALLKLAMDEFTFSVYHYEVNVNCTM